MSAYRIASRYAKSLIDIAIEQNKVEEVNKDMRYLKDTLKASHNSRVFLKSPVINPGVKIKVFDRLFGDKFNVITMKFLYLVLHKRREEHLPTVISEFISYYNQYKNITPVYFTTAVQVDPAVLERIRELSIQRGGVHDVEMHTIVDEKIIGGFIFKFNDNLFDASVRRQLHKMDTLFLENPYLKKIGKK